MKNAQFKRSLDVKDCKRKNDRFFFMYFYLTSKIICRNKHMEPVSLVVLLW